MHENPKREIAEMLFKKLESSGIHYGFWRRTSAFEMRYADLPSKETLNGGGRSELIILNEDGSKVFFDCVD